MKVTSDDLVRAIKYGDEHALARKLGINWTYDGKRETINDLSYQLVFEIASRITLPEDEGLPFDEATP